jgi:outer membrane lipoprotein SlyB
MMAEREMAAANQNKEAEGDIWARNAERDKQATLMGMAHGEAMSERQNAISAEQAKWGAIGQGVSALGGFAGGGFGGGGGGAGAGGGSDNAGGSAGAPDRKNISPLEHNLGIRLGDFGSFGQNIGISDY